MKMLYMFNRSAGAKASTLRHFGENWLSIFCVILFTDRQTTDTGGNTTSLMKVTV